MADSGTSNKVITIHDIARDLGVNASTVSRAISGKGRIGAATKERILAYIEECDFHPNATAQSLAHSRTNNIALLMPQVNELVDIPFFYTCMHAVEEAASAREYDMLLVSTNGHDLKPLERLISNRKVDGMILTRTYQEDAFASYLKEKKFPFVTIGQVGDAAILQVDHKNQDACRELTKKLLAGGMQRLAYLGGDLSQTVNRHRLKGYLEGCGLVLTSASGTGQQDATLTPASGTGQQAAAFVPASGTGQQDAGLTPASSKERTNLIHTNLSSEAEVGEALEKVLAAGADCILCQDDCICDQAIQYLNKKGLEIPKDIKIASCHYSRMLDNYPVGITSVHFDIAGLAKAAARVLLDSLNGLPVAGLTLLDYEVVMEESTEGWKGK